MAELQPTIEVVCILPHAQFRREVAWQPQCSLSAVLESSGVLTWRSTQGVQHPLMVGIHGQRVDAPAAYVVQPFDRVEVYSPLIGDPKEIRRRRADRHPVGRRRRAK